MRNPQCVKDYELRITNCVLNIDWPKPKPTPIYLRSMVTICLEPNTAL